MCSSFTDSGGSEGGGVGAGGVTASGSTAVGGEEGLLSAMVRNEGYRVGGRKAEGGTSAFASSEMFLPTEKEECSG